VFNHTFWDRACIIAQKWEYCIENKRQQGLSMTESKFREEFCAVLTRKTKEDPSRDVNMSYGVGLSQNATSAMRFFYVDTHHTDEREHVARMNRSLMDLDQFISESKPFKVILQNVGAELQNLQKMLASSRDPEQIEAQLTETIKEGSLKTSQNFEQIESIRELCKTMGNQYNREEKAKRVEALMPYVRQALAQWIANPADTEHEADALGKINQADALGNIGTADNIRYLEDAAATLKLWKSCANSGQVGQVPVSFQEFQPKLNALSQAYMNLKGERLSQGDSEDGSKFKQRLHARRVDALVAGVPEGMVTELLDKAEKHAEKVCEQNFRHKDDMHKHAKSLQVDKMEKTAQLDRDRMNEDIETKRLTIAEEHQTLRQKEEMQARTAEAQAEAAQAASETIELRRRRPKQKLRGRAPK